MAFHLGYNRQYRGHESISYPCSYHFPGKDERPILFIPGRPCQGWPLATLQGLTALTGPARDDPATTLVWGKPFSAAGKHEAPLGTPFAPPP
jgi:hypothetical protein